MKWIKTSEQLPKPFTDILFLYNYTTEIAELKQEVIPLSGYYDDDGSNPDPSSKKELFATYTGSFKYKTSEIPYWAEYPKPPKGYKFV